MNKSDQRHRGVLVIVLAIILFMIIAGITLFVVSRDKSFEGYVVRTPEAMYLTHLLPNTPGMESGLIWVDDLNDNLKAQISNLDWKEFNSSTEYSKVRAVGVIKGPGTFGHLGKYIYQIELKEILRNP